MMTVVTLHEIKSDRVRRQIGRRYWTPEPRMEPGQARPGRGGRRKRRILWRRLGGIHEQQEPSTYRESGYSARRREAKKRRRRARGKQRFMVWLGRQTTQRPSGDAVSMNMLEQAICPEGIGRVPADGEAEA